MLQGSDFAGTMVALAVGTHDHIDLFLNGHKGYVFDKNTGQLRELRLGTATETAVEMVPSAQLQAEQALRMSLIRHCSVTLPMRCLCA